ncbi:hypothetical protein C5167_026133 [Papaver somniferum]|uniref:rac guanine nucleotide exchange factor JJ-like n=1 Tax=Papaver somniferum TaxID=3469 RepID=UPI000E6FC0C0|nr:rac guanine nucleotide exchange factor JJ-like [Papaver somniferum]RZC94401.1 hypothetical protein C5167_026133 [Papaver somniferum]
MFDFGRQQQGVRDEHPSDEEHDRSSFSESPLLFGKSSRSCRLAVNEKYSDTPSLTTVTPPTDNENGLKKLPSLPSSSKQNHGEPAAEQQRNIEFTASSRKDETNDEKDGVTSPPLWKYPRSSSSISNSTEVLSSRSRGNYNRFFSFNDATATTTTDFVSNRSQEIARGRQELMDMIRTMPENSYELSLKDLIEHKQQPQPTKDDHHDATPEMESSRNSTNNSSSTTSKVSSKDQTKSNRENNIPVLKRSKSADSSNGKNGPVLLKMFLPFSDFGMHKKKRKNKGSKKSAYYAKVSPKPIPLIEGEKNSTTTTNTSIDKEWWKKRFAVAADEITISHGGLDNRGESSGSSNSSNGSRKMAGLLTCFWSSNTKKTKTISLKGSNY